MRPIWSARCKSGFTFDGKPCRRPCSRGELLCADCATAVVVPEVVAVRLNFINRLRLALAVTRQEVAVWLTKKSAQRTRKHARWIRSSPSLFW
jgi:hypothetical protein